MKATGDKMIGSSRGGDRPGVRPIDYDLFEDDVPPKQEGGLIAAFKRGWNKAFGKVNQQSEQADDVSDDDDWQ